MTGLAPAEASLNTLAVPAGDDGFRAIFDALNDAIAIIDPATGRFFDVNQHACCMFGYTKAEILSRDVAMLSSGIHPYTQEVATETFEKAALGEPQILEWQCRKKGGELFPTEVSLRHAKLGEAPVILVVVRDISARKEISERFQQLAENISDVFWMSTPDKSAMLYVSPAYETIWGRTCRSLYDNPRQWFEAIHEDDRDRVVASAQRQADGAYEEEYRIVRPDGEVRWISDRAFPVRNDNGEVYRIAGAASDITRRKLLADRIEHMAHHDTLTDLPNRAMFAKALERAFARSTRSRSSFAIFSLDLDHFKDVNDTQGHPAGDRLLQMVAERLQVEVRRNDIVARLGGDEFAILLDEPHGPAEIAALAGRIIASLSEPYRIEGIECHVGASIGVAVAGKDGRDAETLMSNADIALYRAKAEGQRTHRFFSKAMNEEVQARVRLTNELRLAIPDGQLFIVYQPQVTAEKGHIIGVEALVRWRHPTRGTLGPAEFLPVAESSGLIGPLGAWVLREACREGRQWIDAGVSPGTISVNLSSVQLNEPLELEELVLASLAESGLPPHLLELELTESTLMELTSRHENMLQRLRRAGVRIALDDFGIGNSSLNLLRRFSIDRLKIARRFVSEITTDARTAAIAKLVLGFAHECGTSVVAQGVETRAQLEVLQEWNCPDIQGFYFAGPMTAEAIAPLLKAGAISASTPDAVSSVA